jgi:Phosphotransferase enzyme family
MRYNSAPAAAMHTKSFATDLGTEPVTRILEAKGFSVIGKPRQSLFPRAESLMTADVLDRSGRKLFIKVGKSRLLGPSKLYTSYRLLLWLTQSGFSNGMISFPKGLGYFRQNGLSFLAQEFVEHRDVWSSQSPIEKFLHFTEVIAALKTIPRCPSFLERYDHRTVLKTLMRYAKYICRNAPSVDHFAVTGIVELFRRNKQLFDKFYGVFSHNDIQAANLLRRSDREEPRFCLIDVETCRVGNEFSDFARCYNREALTCARTRVLATGAVRDLEFSEAYDAVLKLYDYDEQAKKMFDLMIMVDYLMYLHWALNHETDGDSRQFLQSLLSRVMQERFDHFEPV